MNTTPNASHAVDPTLTSNSERIRVASSLLEAGEELPPIRILALQLNVTPNTHLTHLLGLLRARSGAMRGFGLDSPVGGRRGARLARREEGAYRRSSTDDPAARRNASAADTGEWFLRGPSGERLDTGAPAPTIGKMSNGANPRGASVAPSDANLARWFLLTSVLVTGALYAIPYGWYVAYPLVLLSTYVHEIAHGVAATLVGGQFDFLVIHADGSGLASLSVNSSRFAVAFVAGAGLVGPAIGGAALLMLAARPTLARVGLGVFALLSAVALIWVVRNIFGWVFVGVLTAGCGAAARRGTAQFAQAVVGFLGVQLALSVFSRADYLFTEFAITGSGRHPSDVATMAEALWLPYWFWGGVCALLSVTALGTGGWAFLSLSRTTESNEGA